MATMNMDNLMKGVEIVANVSKMGANLADQKAKQAAAEKAEPVDLHQPHTQTVEVKVGGDQSAAQKPIVMKTKKEKHIHKPFPDTRELSEKECELEKHRMELEHEMAQKRMEYQMKVDERNYRDMKEREEYARKQAEEQKELQRKRNRRAGILAGIAGAVLVGTVGYCIYTDYKYYQAGGIPGKWTPLTSKTVGGAGISAVKTSTPRRIANSGVSGTSKAIPAKGDVK